MDEQLFQTRFTEILNKIRELPADDRERLENLAHETRDRRERLKGAINELQESMDYLRLSVKYLVFDLEATRRENAYLRRMIDDLNRNSEQQGRNDRGPNFLDDHDGDDEN